MWENEIWNDQLKLRGAVVRWKRAVRHGAMASRTDIGTEEG